MADLQQELAVLRELQDLRVLGVVAANPDVALVVDGDAVIRQRPLVALARAAPVADEVAGLIELEHRRRGHAAVAARGRRRRGGAHLGAFVQRPRAAVDDPDVILLVDRHADRGCRAASGSAAASATSDRLRSAAPARSRVPAPRRALERAPGRCQGSASTNPAPTKTSFPRHKSILAEMASRVSTEIDDSLRAQYTLSAVPGRGSAHLARRVAAGVRRVPAALRPRFGPTTFRSTSPSRRS